MRAKLEKLANLAEELESALKEVQRIKTELRTNLLELANPKEGKERKMVHWKSLKVGDEIYIEYWQNGRIKTCDACFVCRVYETAPPDYDCGMGPFSTAHLERVSFFKYS